MAKTTGRKTKKAVRTFEVGQRVTFYAERAPFWFSGEIIRVINPSLFSVRVADGTERTVFANEIR